MTLCLLCAHVCAPCVKCCSSHLLLGNMLCNHVTHVFPFNLGLLLLHLHLVPGGRGRGVCKLYKCVNADMQTHAGQCVIVRSLIEGLLTTF